MRQLCNAAFVAQTEWMDEKEYRTFRRELEADPARPVSHGTAALMSLMGAPPGGPR